MISFLLASAVIGCAVSYSKFYLFHVAVLLLFCFNFLLVLKNNFKIERAKLPTKLHYFVLWMFFWYVCTLIWSHNLQSSIVYVFYIFLGLVITTAIAFYGTDLEKQGKVIRVLGVFFGVEIFLSLLEVFTPFRLPISPYSNYLSVFGRSLVDPDVQRVSSSVSIPTGFAWNPNNLATTMTMILPFFLCNKRKLVKYSGIVSAFVLVISAGSRGNVLAISFILVLYLYFLSNKRAAVLGTLLPALGIVALLVLSPILMNSGNEKVRDVVDSFQTLKKYLTINEGGNDSIGTRQFLIKRGLNELAKTYGLGVGGGASKAIGGVDVRGYVGDVPMHNFWIEVLVEGGVIFFITFMLWYLYILYRLFKIARSKGIDRRMTYFASATFLSMCGFLIGAVSTSSTIYFLPMWILYGFAIMTINNHKIKHPISQ